MDRKSAEIFGKAIASISVCAAGAFSMHISNGSTGIGWAILGIFIIWAS